MAAVETVASCSMQDMPEWQNRPALKLLDGYPFDVQFTKQFLALSPQVTLSDDIVATACLQTLASLPQGETLSLSDKLTLARASLSLGYSQLDAKEALQQFANDATPSNKFAIPPDDVRKSLRRIQQGRIHPYWVQTFNAIVDANGGRPLHIPSYNERKLPYVVDRSEGAPFVWPEWAVKYNHLDDAEVAQTQNDPTWNNAYALAILRLFARQAIDRTQAVQSLTFLQGEETSWQNTLELLLSEQQPKQKPSRRQAKQIIAAYRKLLEKGESLQLFRDFAQERLLSEKTKGPAETPASS